MLPPSPLPTAEQAVQTIQAYERFCEQHHFTIKVTDANYMSITSTARTSRSDFIALFLLLYRSMSRHEVEEIGMNSFRESRTIIFYIFIY